MANSETESLFLDALRAVMPFSYGMEAFFRSFGFALGSTDSHRQCFDLSITSENIAKIRFSVNDFACKGRLMPKIAEEMRRLDRYDMPVFREYCAFLGDLSQFDVGIQWKNGENAPIIKIYHEETSDVPVFFEKDENRRRFAALFGLESMPDYNPDIVCADFFPGGGTDVKFYAANSVLPEKMPAGFRFPVHYAEPPCFYFVMDGLISGRRKYYMAYPPETVNNPVPDMYEICRMMSSVGATTALRVIGDWVKIASGYGCKVSPTLFSVSDNGILSAYCRFVDSKLILRGRSK